MVKALERLEDPSALHHLGLDLIRPDSPVERVDDAPPAHPLAVEPELVPELVESAADRRAPDVPPPVAKKRRGVERRLADDRLGVDRQPGLALAAKHVASLEVLVAEDELSLSRRQLACRRLSRLDQALVERPP